MIQPVVLSFAIEPLEGERTEVPTLIPVLNGIRLTELILQFEQVRGFDPAGGYGGLVPQWFKYGPLDRYFLGDFEENSYFAKMGAVYLLGCECGEVGCWPLTARVNATGESITWDCFQQPHRRERDYSGFGPFVFDPNEYREAVSKLRDEFPVRIPHTE